MRPNSTAPAPPPVLAPLPLAGHVVVVTGATSGIGERTALGLARTGAQVVLVGRDAGRIERTRARIAGEFPDARLEAAVADLARLAEVRRVAGELGLRHPSIFALVNNAGAVYAHREVTPEGHEATWALNVLAPYLLTHLLAGPLRRGAPARVVNVASAAHRGRRLDFEDLEGHRRYSGFRTYGRSKLALLLLTYEFARRWSGSGITVNALHPGYVRTGFGKNTPGAMSGVIRFLDRLFAIPAEEGARTPIYLASSPEVADANGLYFARGRPVPSSRASYDAASAARLWQVCAEQTGVGR